MDYAFDRFLRYDELRAWLEAVAAEHPGLVRLETYGRSHEGRELVLAVVTDFVAGPADEKPALWVDANIHSVEVTGGVAALHLIHRLVTGHGADERVTRALASRTFYVAPRVNPDGVEAALADRPSYRRSSLRRWPWRRDFDAPGLHPGDVDGDGHVRTMRIADPNGPWTPSAADPRVMAPVGPAGTASDVPRYRLLTEGEVVGYDGFTIPTPPPAEGLDLNRNFPAGWGTGVRGSGDHPLSEPEIDALVRAVRARPNVCGYNAYHTAAGVLLRPSSTKADADLPPADLWGYRQLGELCTAATGYPVHSVFEDFTWDKAHPMAGAADDWAYEHLGVHAFTTEFWDVIRAATGAAGSRDLWYVGPTEEQEVAVARWCDEQGYADALEPWRPFDHPQLGPVDIGGWDEFRYWSNAPADRVLAEVRGHAEFAIDHALAAPCLEILHAAAVPLGDGHWRVEAGLANTGYFATDVTALARKENLVLPVVATLSGAEVVGGVGRRECGQLKGRVSGRFNGGNDGTPDRALVTWVVRAEPGTVVSVEASHDRAGTARAEVRLG